MIIAKASPSLLFFDSGLGGLSVYDAVRRKLPHSHAHYFFDHAAFPYGDKSEAFLIKRVTKLLSSVTGALNVRLVVVACNTASTIVLPALRACLSVPVVGTVPAIKPAALLSQRKVVGLLATPGTIHRHYTDELIGSFASDCKVLRIGSTSLVRLAEKHMAGGAVTLEEVASEVAVWQKLPEEQRPDVVVLGCTHFPLLKDLLQQALPGTLLLDSGEAIARRVESLIGLYHLEEVLTGESKGLALHTGTLKEGFYGTALARAGFPTPVTVGEDGSLAFT